MVTKLESASGMVYLHTHKATASAEIAEALQPYVGRFAWFYPANTYGHVDPHRSTYGLIEAVNGADVRVFVPRTGYRGTVDAFEGFGHYCTTIDAEPETEHTCGPGISWGCDVPGCDGSGD